MKSQLLHHRQVGRSYFQLWLVRVYNHSSLGMIVHEYPLAMAGREARQVVLLLLQPWCRIMPYAGPGDTCRQPVEYTDD